MGVDSDYKYSDWKHQSIKLNKDGTPRKYYNPIHLHTKESREKQEIKFREYQERKKKEYQIRRLQRQQLEQDVYNKAIDVLLKNKIDLNLLDIRIKRR